MLTTEQQLHDRARKCRELADTAVTDEGRSILCDIAERLEREAALAEPLRDGELLTEAGA